MAVFKKKTIWNYLILFSGLFLIGLFIFISYKDQEATTGGILAGVILGAIFFTVGIIFMFFNFKAYLSIADGQIKGKYNYFGRIDCVISDVAFVMPQINSLSILLKSGKRYVIGGIENSWELAREIRRQIFTLETESPDSLHTKLRAAQAAWKKKLYWVLGSIALLFANILIAVFLTGGKELYDFSNTDWILFFIMGVVEILTVVVTFYFAGQCGRCLLPIEQLKYRLKGACIASQSLPSGNVKRIYTDPDQNGRIVVFGFPNDESVYYCIQEIMGDFQLETIDTSEIFANEDELPNEALSSFIDITDHFQ